jgi:hypothetical protein
MTLSCFFRGLVVGRIFIENGTDRGSVASLLCLVHSPRVYGSSPMVLDCSFTGERLDLSVGAPEEARIASRTCAETDLPGKDFAPCGSLVRGCGSQVAPCADLIHTQCRLSCFELIKNRAEQTALIALLYNDLKDLYVDDKSRRIGDKFKCNVTQFMVDEALHKTRCLNAFRQRLRRAGIQRAKKHTGERKQMEDNK